MSAPKKKSCKATTKRSPVSSDERLDRLSCEDASQDNLEEQQAISVLDPVSRLLWSQALRTMH